MKDYSEQFDAPCDVPGCDQDARWRVTSDSPTPRVTCDCDTAPARRWADSDGRTVL